MPIRRHRKYVSDDDLNTLLSTLTAGTTVDGDKRIHFHDNFISELERILPDAFDADRALTPRQVRHILRHALWNCRREGTVTADALLGRAQEAARAVLATPQKPYAMWSKFRAVQMPFHGGFDISWDGIRLRSASELPDYMDINDYLLDGHGDIDPHAPAFYGYIVYECAARSDEEAATRILDAEQLFLAAFNIYELGLSLRIGSRMRPEGKLLSGPYHFLYEEERFIGDEKLWYNLDYSEDDWTASPMPMDKVLVFIPRVEKVFTALASHPLRAVLVKVLHLLQEGMATRDYSYRLLRYWSALEQLYGDPGNGQKDYKQIIRRAIFAENNKALARWKLAHIARLRNDYVHAGNDDGDLQTMCQYLRHLLFRHVHSLLFHEGGLTRLSDWHQVVDLPGDEAELDRLRGAIERRTKMMERDRRTEQGITPRHPVPFGILSGTAATAARWGMR